MIGDKHADSIETTERNGRKTLTTVQGLPKKFDQKKILKVIKKKFGRFGVLSVVRHSYNHKC
jgi:translation initiation factor 1